MRTENKSPVTNQKKANGCLRAAFLMILPLFLCYGATWLFARFGGEWATDRDIPVPENSQFLSVTFDYGLFASKNSLYIQSKSPEELRQGFIDNEIPMTPIRLEGISSIDYDGMYGTYPLFHRRSALQELHDLSARYVTRWWSDFTPTCQAVYVYQTLDAVLKDFPEVNVPENSTAFMIRTCWPNVSFA